MKIQPVLNKTTPLGQLLSVGRSLMFCGFIASVTVLGGCGGGGSDDTTATDGTSTSTGTSTDTTGGTTTPNMAALDSVKLESCSICHDQAGEPHQAVYNKYSDASTLKLTINNVSSASETGGKFTVTVKFSITKSGAAYDDPALANLNQKSFYAVQYDSAKREYLNSQSLLTSSSGKITNVTSNGGGSYTLTKTGVAYAPEQSDAQVYGYIAQGAVVDHVSGGGAEFPAGTHVHLYDNVSNAALPFGAAAASNSNAYQSLANIEGCQKCHGTPYLKHGYRGAEVAGIPDFAGCKSCHYDNRNGGHPDWQFMVDDPVGWATGAQPTADYSYKAKLMNDTHMAHAMEFPYPTSMANCTTCHEGKLEQVLDDKFFTAETCKSCHAVRGINAKAGEEYYQAMRAPALESLWPEFHNNISPTVDCQTCHSAKNGYIGPALSKLHSGYNKEIYQADGKRYSDLYTVTIDSITRNGNQLTVAFSSNNASVVPQLLVSFYGWDTKHYIIPSHSRDLTQACAGRGCTIEYTPESSGGSANPLFTEAAGSKSGSWSVTLDTAAYKAPNTASIPALIADGSVRKAEISITPKLKIGNVNVALNAVSQTFDLVGSTIVADYYKGANEVVENAKCNVCHDSLATTFHDGSGRGGGGVQVCKHCHSPSFAGSHLEMQSRSIESYVHAIHSFQDFDPGDTFKTFDPVLAKRYSLHTQHVFPNFTIRNCEACHKEGIGAYDVPAQNESLFGLISGSDTVNTWFTLDANDNAVEADHRKIGTVPSYITGPAARACGSCHTARFINQDQAGELEAFNAHRAAFGTLVDDTTVLYPAINKIMSNFK